MQKGDEASPSISLTDRGQLVKMLINHMVYFDQIYLYILTLSGHWYAKRGRGFPEKFAASAPPPTAHTDADCSGI